MDVRGWKKTYWKLNEANYDRECVKRWGGWAGYEDEGKKENSDSDGPEEGEEEREDDDDDGSIDNLMAC